MPKFDLINPGWNRTHLEEETLRVFDICDGCRRCFNLCPSFTTLIDRLDEYESEMTRFSAKDFSKIEQECYYCKLCFNHCPYSPPHQYDLDFPRLMAAWKQQRAREGNASLRDKLLVQTDLMGKIGSLTAPLVNGALRNRFIRNILDHVAGIHRKREILPFQTDTFTRWWKRKPSRTSALPLNGKVAFFPGCLVTYQAPDIGKAAVQVLEKNGVEVILPPGQQCCGMPRFDLGDIAGMTKVAETHLKIFGPFIEQGYDIVIPAPSCSLMFKREYPYFQSDPDMKRLADHTFDLCEYLMRMKRDHRLSLEFPNNPGTVAYQIPCHLRDQNIGFKSKELMELTGATVHLIEKCSGHDGAWSAKTEFFDLSMKIATKATREIVDGEFNLVASDCPLSALQLKQALGSHSSRPALHPIQIVRNAYGMSS